ncbi:MAG: hypothetical protein QNK29_09390 [Desulfobacterales bacterium]|nr:hypothetical protein [Desulfobacterales bacterium]
MDPYYPWLLSCIGIGVTERNCAYEWHTHAGNGRGGVSLPPESVFIGLAPKARVVGAGFHGAIIDSIFASSPLVPIQVSIQRPIS